MVRYSSGAIGESASREVGLELRATTTDDLDRQVGADAGCGYERQNVLGYSCRLGLGRCSSDKCGLFRERELVSLKVESVPRELVR